MKKSVPICAFILLIFSSYCFSFRSPLSLKIKKLKNNLFLYGSELKETANIVDDAQLAEEALVRSVEAEVMAETGFRLEDLINPSTVINLSRDIIKLKSKQSLPTTTEAERLKIQTQIDKKSEKLVIEKRAVMKDWLKNLFVFQSALALVISYLMVYDQIPGTTLPLAIRVLGFWMWWLFIIPSMRARKPATWEKDALNVAFLASPVVSLLIPVFSRDVALIWWANAGVVLASYVYGYNKSAGNSSDGEGDGEGSGVQLPGILKQAFRALDYGSGQERGARK